MVNIAYCHSEGQSSSVVVRPTYKILENKPFDDQKRLSITVNSYSLSCDAVFICNRSVIYRLLLNHDLLNSEIFVHIPEIPASSQAGSLADSLIQWTVLSSKSHHIIYTTTLVQDFA